MLWKASCEYFQWCDDNPWYKNEAVKAGEHFGKNVQASIPRPYTISGFCIFLDISQETFSNYGSKEEYKDFFGVVSKIKDVIFTQKFEGAAVGAFNANIIARDLGLIDKQRKEHTGLGGKPLSHKDMSKNEIARRIAFALYQGIKAQGRMKGDKIP